MLLISPEKIKLIKTKIKKDASLVKLLELYQNGWDMNIEDCKDSSEIGKYIKEKNNITVSDELIFHNNQVIVPKVPKKRFYGKTTFGSYGNR